MNENFPNIQEIKYSKKSGKQDIFGTPLPCPGIRLK